MDVLDTRELQEELETFTEERDDCKENGEDFDYDDEIQELQDSTEDSKRIPFRHSGVMG